MYNLEQQYIEQYLWEKARESGLIDLRWQSEATAIEENPDGVTLSVRDPHGDYRLRAEWLLAADGARSAVRAQCGLRLRGDNHEGRYVIADVQMDHDYPTVRRALFDPVSNPGRTVLIHRQPDNIWRIDYQLEDGEDENVALSEAHVRAMVGAILTEIGHDKHWALEWWSVYSANTLALDDYRRGRVLFIGDSAHVVPIFGVRGLNNGMADAENAAWKLARVLHGEAGEALLDSYSPERRGATLDVFANATKSARFMTPPTPGWRLVRDAALALAVDHDFARPFANPRQMTPYTYAGSPATCADEDGFPGGPRPGAVAANVVLGDGTWLSDRLGIGFTGLLFSSGADVAAVMRSALERLDARFRLLVIGAGGEGALADTEGRIARAYGAQPGSFYLLRPDMHVAARWLQGDPTRVEASMKTILWGKEA
jgi:3-(3-hydroxy-phenyl)propionate hydroxylase